MPENLVKAAKKSDFLDSLAIALMRRVQT